MLFRDAWSFQVKRAEDGNLALLVAAPRVVGSMAAHRVKGVNFALHSLYEAMRAPVQICPLTCDMEMDRALTNRYKHNVNCTDVFVDLDDTPIGRGKLNVDLAAYLL
jgi:carbamoyl-phosphate synthase large subunit